MTVAFGCGRRSQHRAAVAAGTIPAFRDSFERGLTLRCTKCKQLVGEMNITDHLKKCQPKGAGCGKCNKVVLPDEFLVHFKQCKK